MAQILGNSSHRSHPEHACTCCKDRKYAKKGLNKSWYIINRGYHADG
jgi:hypothetical protein